MFLSSVSIMSNQNKTREINYELRHDDKRVEPSEDF